MNFITRTKSILHDQKKLKALFTVVVILSIAALGFSGYVAYKQQVEKSISNEVNLLVQEKKNILSKYEIGGAADEEYTNELSSLSENFNRIYLEYPNTKNGIRSLITSSEIDIKLNYLSKAEEKLLLVIDDGGELSPIAQYLLALVYENQGNFQKGLNVLKPFQGKYLTHYLKPVIMLTEARLYKLLGQREEAVATYTKILQNQDFSIFFENAEEQIDLLELEKKESTGETKPEDGFSPNFSDGLSPDYLNISN